MKVRGKRERHFQVKYLFSEWDTLCEKLKNRQIFLFLDYDGTLSPIVDVPCKAIITKDIRNLIRILSKVCDVAIISGRSLVDIKKMAGVKNIYYAGNHGLEMEGTGVTFKYPLKSVFKKNLHSLKNELLTKFLHIRGILIENKGITLSVHYRLVNAKKIALVKKIFSKVIGPYRYLKIFKITLGKKIFEIRPMADWDKGRCVLWLLKKVAAVRGKKNIFPIYIGDDVTDEDAFKAIRDIGWTIYVGKPKKSSASYYLRNTDEVPQLLEKIKGLF